MGKKDFSKAQKQKNTKKDNANMEIGQEIEKNKNNQRQDNENFNKNNKR